MTRSNLRMEGLLTASCLIALGLPAALAASGSQPAQNPAGAGFAVGFAIAYLFRRRPIGGWLLYFYMQLYGSLLINAILATTTIGQLDPSGWDSSQRYVWYVFSTVPVLAAMATEAVVGTYLLFRRAEGTVRLMRNVLLAVLVTSAASLCIDLEYFNEAANLFFDVLTVAFTAMWLAYFRKSKRVRRVFVDHDWNYEAQQKAVVPRTPEERRYLKKRALVFAAATFIVLLIGMGSALGDKKPDIGIFFVPLFYALIAAAVGWCLPITATKRSKLAAVVAQPGKSQQ